MQCQQAQHGHCCSSSSHMLDNVQALLPEDPLKDPREEGAFMGPLESWVLEEAVAAYTGTGPSLQGALDIYKRNVFLAIRRRKEKKVLRFSMVIMGGS